MPALRRTILAAAAAVLFVVAYTLCLPGRADAALRPDQIDRTLTSTSYVDKLAQGRICLDARKINGNPSGGESAEAARARQEAMVYEIRPDLSYGLYVPSEFLPMNAGPSKQIRVRRYSQATYAENADGPVYRITVPRAGRSGDGHQLDLKVECTYLSYSFDGGYLIGDEDGLVFSGVTFGPQAFSSIDDRLVYVEQRFRIFTVYSGTATRCTESLAYYFSDLDVPDSELRQSGWDPYYYEQARIKNLSDTAWVSIAGDGITNITNGGPGGSNYINGIYMGNGTMDETPASTFAYKSSFVALSNTGTAEIEWRGGRCGTDIGLGIPSQVTASGSAAITARKYMNPSSVPLANGAYSFRLEEVDASGSVLSNLGSASNVGNAVTFAGGPSGNIPGLTYTINDLGAHYYRITENVPSPTNPLVSYDTHQEMVRVDLALDPNDPSPTMRTIKASVTYINTGSGDTSSGEAVFSNIARGKVHYMWKKGAAGSPWQEISSTTATAGTAYQAQPVSSVYGNVGGTYRTTGHTTYAYWMTYSPDAPQIGDVESPPVAPGTSFSVPHSDVYLWATETIDLHTVHYMWKPVNGSWGEVEAARDAGVPYGQGYTVKTPEQAGISASRGCSMDAYGKTSEETPPPEATGTAPASTLVVQGDVWLWATEDWIVYNPSISVEKAVSPEHCSPATAGQEITWSFAITNTGDCDLTDLSIDDPYLESRGASVGDILPATIAPGQTAIASAKTTLLQGELDAGEIVNVASARGKVSGTWTPQDGQQVSSPQDDAAVTMDRIPALGISKTAHETSAGIGDSITYTVKVTNTGNVTLAPVSIDDPLLGISARQVAASLAPGQEAEVELVYPEVGEDDAVRKTVVNTATARGTPPTGVDAPEPPSATATIPISAHPSISIEKTASPERLSPAAANDRIAWTFDVTNTGDITLGDVTVSDPYLAALGEEVSLPQTTLAPGQSSRVTVVSQVSQAEVDAGGVDNSATASGVEPVDGATVSSAPSTAHVELARHADLGISKTVDKATASIGDSLDYGITVSNTGNVTLTSVEIDDPLLGKAGAVVAEALAPGASATVTGTYGPVTEADAVEGKVVNTAYARGVPPAGMESLPARSASAETSVETHPSLTLSKGAVPSASADARAGDEITWSFDVYNDGDITLDGISINDAYLAGRNKEVVLDKTSISPGETAHGTVRTELSQGEVDAGRAFNEAVASGHDIATGETVDDADDAEVALGRSAALDVRKTVDKARARIGDTLSYEITVVNTGTVTLSSVLCTDAMVGLDGYLIAESLAPGESAAVTREYGPVDEEDAIASPVVNAASASATPPADVAAPARRSNEVRTEVVPRPSLSLVKAVEPDHLDSPRAGDAVVWEFAVANTGDITLSGVRIADEMLESRGIAVMLDKTVLAPGEQAEARATMELTQQDIDAGLADNAAIAIGTEPQKMTEVASPPSAAAVSLDARPAISIDKTVDREVAEIGDVLEYEITIENTGNVTLSDVTLDDALLGISGIAAGELAPGGKIEKKGSWTVTEDDGAAGEVVNTASCAGFPPGAAPPVEDWDAVETTVVSHPSLSLAKAPDRENIASAKVGDEVLWTFIIGNTGDISLTGISVEDPMLEAAGIEVSVPGDLVLEPGGTARASARYAVTQEDIDSGIVENAASAHAVSTAGEECRSGIAEASVDLGRTSMLALEKGASPRRIDDASEGDEIVFSMKVTNTGNTTLDGLIVHDGLPGLEGLRIDWDARTAPGPASGYGTLVPGESVTAYATYKVTSADLKEGKVVNTAYATAFAGDGMIRSNESSATVELHGSAQVNDESIMEKIASTGNGGAALPAVIALAAIAAVIVLIASGRHKGRLR